MRNRAIACLKPRSGWAFRNRTRRIGGGIIELGLIMSAQAVAQAVGGIRGGLLLTFFADRTPAIRLLGWGGLFSGVLLVPLLNYPLVYPVLWPSLVLVAIAGLPFAMFGSAQMTLLQTEAEPQVRGRVFSAYFAVFGNTQLGCVNLFRV